MKKIFHCQWCSKDFTTLEEYVNHDDESIRHFNRKVQQ